MQQLLDQFKNGDSAVAHLDLNLAKISLSLILTEGTKNGPWKITTKDKDGEKTVEGSRRLTKAETCLFLELLEFYEKCGMPEDGRFSNTTNAIMRDMLEQQGKSTKHLGGFQTRRIKKSIDNVAGTFLKFHGCFKENGVTKTHIVSFPLIKEAEMYERDQSPGFFLSRFRFPEEIVQNMRAGYWKPTRLAVFAHLRSGKESSLWLYLDRVLTYSETHNRDLNDLCAELMIQSSRPRDNVRRMKKICNRMRGLPLTCGAKIKYCHVVESSTGFKLVAERTFDVPKIDHKNKPALSVTTAEDKKSVLLNWFESLPPRKRIKVQKYIDDRLEVRSREKHGKFWGSEFSINETKRELLQECYDHESNLYVVNGAEEKRAMIASEPAGPAYETKPLMAQLADQLLRSLEKPPVLLLEYKWCDLSEN